MWVTCLRDNLSRGLSSVSRAVSSRSMLPVTQNVLLESDNGQLKITATNTEISISTWIGAQIENEGAVTVPARILTDYINALSGEAVNIDLLTDPERVKIICGSSDATINGIDANQFPPIPPVSGGPSTVIPAASFRSSLERVIVAAATDDSRPVLTGVKIELAESSYTLAAADGFRLAVEKGSLSNEIAEDVGIIVPAKTLSELERLLSDGSENVEMSVDSESRSAKFKLDSSEIVTSLVQGTFPDYGKLIPENQSTVITVDSNKIKQASRAASIFARDGSNIVRFVVEKNDESENDSVVKVLSKAEEMGENENSITAVVRGPATKVAFNSKFLLDVLNVLDGKELIIEADSSSSPGVFRSESNPEYKHIVMPMFVQW
ncbi:MAG: DNA polymerase III subunit beta [Dehalococcoidia bacterium]|nr:DNA polymerase III subunit beta [Dehalococcoidia bacterium]